MLNVLVLNFFPAFVPPANGGELRYFHLYEKLSKHCDVTLLSPTFAHHTREVVEHSKTFREYRIPKENIHEHLHDKIQKNNIGFETSALECALSAKFPNTYHLAYLKLYPRADIIIHEFPYMLEYDLFFGFDDKLRVYNSHNYESSLVKQIWSGPHAEKYQGYIHDLEKRLIHGADLVFATSKEERNIFIREFGIDGDKVMIAPNSINPGELMRNKAGRTAERKRALFIGSGHPPNVEAVHFIEDELSKKCSSIDFYIAGACCNHFNSRGKSNVYLLGRIDEKRKKKLFEEADFAINPMFSGAGTNLKTLEFLTSEMPLISTGLGVRGIDLIDGKHFILAERANFAKKLNEFDGKTSQLASMARNGKMYIDKNYSWEKTANHVHEALKALWKKKEKKKRVLLVLNDFEVSNPASGGEIRINRMYAHLSAYDRILFFCMNNDGMIKRSEITRDYVEISFPKTLEHLRKEHTADCEFAVSVKDIINSSLCNRNGFFLAILRAFESSAGAVIFSHPYMAPALKVIQNRNVVYESLNCELSLKAEILKGHPRYHEYIKQVEKVERMVCERSKFILSGSDDDHPPLAKLTPAGTEIFTIENGVEVKEDCLLSSHSGLKKMFGGHPVIVFVGSAHKPNMDALNFIVDTLASQLRHCYFVVIGTVCTDLKHSRLPNLLLFGKMDEAYKDTLLRVCDVAINPIFSGSGSNLKLAEYFAYKIPVVTTPIGARGYKVKNNHEAIVCKEYEFREKILEVLDNKSLRKALTTNAFAYVKSNLDWRILAKKYHHVLLKNLFQG